VTWEVLAVALAALAVLALAIYLAGMTVRGLVRQQAREREMLINQIMHLAGRTWSPPPSPEPLDLVDEQFEYVDPSQLPE